MTAELANIDSFDTLISQCKNEVGKLSEIELKELRPVIKKIVAAVAALPLIGITPNLVVEMLAGLTGSAIAFCEFSEAQLMKMPQKLREIIQFAQQAIKRVSEYKALLFAGAGAAVGAAALAEKSDLVGKVCAWIIKLANYLGRFLCVLTPLIAVA